jgi:hypothetical protein
LKEVDLTNACSVISFWVAQRYLVNGSPDKEELEKIFAKAAPQVGFVRILLGMDPSFTQDVDLYDLMNALKKNLEDDPFDFEKWFPHVVPENVLNTHMFDEEVKRDQPLPILRQWLVDVIKKTGTCAVSILFNEHIATGCFSFKVWFHEHIVNSYQYNTL